MVKRIEYPGRFFEGIVTDQFGNIYFLGFSLVRNGDPTRYLYLFDTNSYQVTKDIPLPLRGIDHLYFTDSEIYIFGTQSPKEDNIYPYLVFKYNKVTQELRQIHEVKAAHVNPGVNNGLFFYGIQGYLTGAKQPKIFIYDLEKEKVDAEIVGKGLGPNPLTSFIIIGLSWLLLPFMFLLGFVFSIFRF